MMTMIGIGNINFLIETTKERSQAQSHATTNILGKVACKEKKEKEIVGAFHVGQ